MIATCPNLSNTKFGVHTIFFDGYLRVTVFLGSKTLYIKM